MSGPARWFDPPEPADSDPPTAIEPAGLLLIPGPAAGPARTVETGFAARAVPRSLPPPTVAADPPRALRQIGIIPETAVRGSVSLVSHHTSAPTPPIPWQRLDEAGGGPGGNRPWPIEGDDVPLSRRLSHLLQPSLDLLLSRRGPLDWPHPLLPYQLVGVRELVDREGLLLADDMGLGKTLQSIAAIRVLLVRREVESALVVAPAGLISQWRAELRRWAPELRVSTAHGAQADRHWQWRTPAHVYLTSYETLRTDFSESPHAPVARLWDLVVLDEAQRIKNASAEVSRACKRLRRKRQWALTGTPLENSPDDLISILEFVDPKMGRELRRFLFGAGLREHLRRVQLRRRKADVLHDLPPKLVSQVVLPLTPRQRESYDQAEREGVIELRSFGNRVETRNVLDLIGRLRQICNFCPVTGESSKLNDLRERLALLGDEGHKALVFTQFASPAFGAKAIAARLGPSAIGYTGDQTTESRDRALALFRSDPTRTALVLSVRAGGQGLNLQEASYVFHFDRWWNPAVVEQAEARSHRLGQRRPVNVYAYTSENTIEERLERVLREKRLLFEELVDDVSLDVATALTGDELFALFGLNAPPAAHEATPRIETTAGDAAALAARVQAVLARHGWRGESSHPSGQAVDLRLIRATKVDGDDGAASILHARCLAQIAPADAGDVRDLAATLRTPPVGTARGLLVCPGGFTADASTLAADRDITLWDERALPRIDG